MIVHLFLKAFSAGAPTISEGNRGRQLPPVISDTTLCLMSLTELVTFEVASWPKVSWF